MKTIILIGIPGSGKSTWVGEIQEDKEIFSADDFFIHEGEYRFEPLRLGEAHRACLKRFTQEVVSGSPKVLVVDNTNTTVDEIAPYVAISQAYGRSVELIWFHTDPVEGARRNLHGVPLEVCLKLSRRLEQLQIPSHWDLAPTLIVNGVVQFPFQG